MYYEKVPVSVKPEKEGEYDVFDPDGTYYLRMPFDEAKFGKQFNGWFMYLHPDSVYLRPVPVSPDVEEAARGNINLDKNWRVRIKAATEKGLKSVGLWHLLSEYFGHSIEAVDRFDKYAESFVEPIVSIVANSTIESEKEQPAQSPGNMHQQIADIIEKSMNERGLNRKEFAEMMCVQPSIITRWLSGTHNFTLDTLVSIEDKLGMKIVQLASARLADMERENRELKEGIEEIYKTTFEARIAIASKNLLTKYPIK